METGLSLERGKVMRGGTSNGKRRERDHNNAAAKIEPFVPRSDHNPKELRTWAKSTGFVSDYSGEAGTSTTASEKFDSVVGFVDDQREGGSSPKIEIDPVLGVARPNRDNEIEEPVSGSKHGAIRSEKDRILRSKDVWNGTVGNQYQRRKNGDGLALALEAANGGGGGGGVDRKVGLRGNDGDANGMVNLNRDGNGHGLGVSSAVAPLPEQKKEEEGVITEGDDVKVNLYAEREEPTDRGSQGPLSGMKYGLRENPGLG